MTFKKILGIVAAFYDIEVKDICGVRRAKELVKARQIVCYLARKELNKSSPSIGRELGGRDHTTVLYAARKIASDIHENENLSHELDSILKLTREDDGYVEKYLEQKKVKQKEIKRNLVVDFKKLSKKNLSSEQLQRQDEILNKYKKGWTFAEIAKEYQLTRERIRQITEKALLYKVRELWDQGIEIDPQKLLRQERYKHLLKMKERHGIPKKKPIVKKEKRWSKYYDYCRKCATRTIKHQSYGYCRRCYPKTELFKSIQRASRLKNIRKRRKYVKDYSKIYSKRPEVVARIKIKWDLKYFGGNREKALIRDEERCQFCGISRVESYKKYNKDLSVIHIRDIKDNSLENLLTLCKKCFYKELEKRRKSPENFANIR